MSRKWEYGLTFAVVVLISWAAYKKWRGEAVQPQSPQSVQKRPPTPDLSEKWKDTISRPSIQENGSQLQPYAPPGEKTLPISKTEVKLPFKYKKVESKEIIEKMNLTFDGIQKMKLKGFQIDEKNMMLESQNKKPYFFAFIQTDKKKTPENMAQIEKILDIKLDKFEKIMNFDFPKNLRSFKPQIFEHQALNQQSFLVVLEEPKTKTSSLLFLNGQSKTMKDAQKELIRQLRSLRPNIR
jgi:hypothetical protein